jgi:predicted small lipoprotein YifL
MTRSRSWLARGTARLLAGALAALLLSGSLAACGKVGPPQPYPPGAEREEEEEEAQP